MAYGLWLMAMREMRVEDLEAVAALCAQLGYTATVHELRERFPILIKRGDGLFVADMDGAIAGWVHVLERILLESPAHAELGGLVVDENCRRRGIGRALVERSIAWTRERGLPKLRLRSNISRPEAHAFYPALGFKLVKTQHAYEIST
jgi:GNAT superfamily N-acetyltransferase